MSGRTAVSVDPAALDELFREWNKSDQPGVVAGIAHPTAGRWSCGYGLASIEIPLANTPHTRMRIGSVTKMFTGLAVLLLAERGRLSIDDSIRRYLPELPQWANEITLRHLLTHTSGMRCYIDLLFNSGNSGRPMTREVALAVSARQSAVNFSPGEHFCYSNGGYDLLALIIERVSDRDFADYLRSQVFAPIGMQSTALKRSDSELLAGCASLHVKQADGHFERGFFGAPLSGGGGIVSTVDDMLLWLAHVHHPRVGNRDTWKAMLMPGVLNDGQSVGYSAGLNLDTYHGLRIAHHSGAVIGGLCMCVTLPELELDVIVIANRDDVPIMRLTEQMIDLCVGRISSRPPARAHEPEASGTFHARRSGTVLRLDATDAGAELSVFGAKVALRREAGALVAEDALLDLRLEPLNADLDAVSAVRLIRQGSNEIFERIARSPDKKPDAATICGVYRCEDVEACATISMVDDRCLLCMAGPYGRDAYVLERLGEHLWVSAAPENPQNFGASLEFAANADSIGAFHLSTGRTWRLPFARLGDQRS